MKALIFLRLGLNGNLRPLKCGNSRATKPTLTTYVSLNIFQAFFIYARLFKFLTQLGAAFTSVKTAF